MLKNSVDRICDLISDKDIVLDVGGWACPFNRANYVLDSEPYETRGYYSKIGRESFVGPKKEFFSKETWIQIDICGHKPWPFPDKFFDWAICSHVLEDIRDPLFVCQELSRVAKRGYIEVPSRLWESCRGIESSNSVGLSHHRWLIELASDNQLLFLMKYGGIHSHWKYSFPKRFLNEMDDDKKYITLWWDNEIISKEVTIHGLENQLSELENFIETRRPYTWFSKTVDRNAKAFSRLVGRFVNKIFR
jgi:SAM-dependent methyltransferase